MAKETPSEQIQSADTSDEREARLGKRIHQFTTRSKTAAVPGRKYLELLGIIAIACVPIGLGYFKGTMGTVIAVLGAAVGLICYLLSLRKATRPGTVIEVFELGFVCSQGGASREISWNEVTDIGCHQLPTPSGTPSLALVLEVVANPPLIIVVGGRFAEPEKVGQLLEALKEVWLPVWSRRARVLLETNHSLQVGRAQLSWQNVQLDGRTLAWSEVQGIDKGEAVDRLSTAQGPEPVETAGMIIPFPSTAQRLAALASSPPKPTLLLPSKES